MESSNFSENAAKKASEYIDKLNDTKGKKRVTLHAPPSSNSSDCDSVSGEDELILSPHKIREMKRQNEENDKTLKRYRALNMDLQEKLLASENRVCSLQRDNDDLSRKYKNLSKQNAQLKLELERKGKENERFQKIMMLKEEADVAKEVKIQDSEEESFGLSILQSGSLTPPFNEDFWDQEKPFEIDEHPTSNENIPKKLEFEKPFSDRTVQKSEAFENNDKDEKKIRKNNELKELHPGRNMPIAAWKQLLKHNYGVKGDSQFVKTLLLKIFDIAEVRSSTIHGRNAPNVIKKNKDAGTALPLSPPALNKKKLTSLKNCLIEKIRLEITDDMTIAESLKDQKLKEEIAERTKDTKFNKYIRDRKETL